MKQAYKRTTRTAANGEWFLVVVVMPLVVLTLVLKGCAG